MKLPTTRPLIYVITKGDATEQNFDKKRIEILDLVRSAIDADIPLVQLREKGLSSRSVFELTSQASAIAAGSETRILVNDRPDIAAAAGADGVHLTARSLTTRVVRSYFPDLLIGVSTHSAADVQVAVDDGADLVAFGPIFTTPGKGEATGLRALREVCITFSTIPIIGLGGIDSTNFHSVIEAGAAGVAAIRWFNEPGSLSQLAKHLKDG